MGNSPWSSVFSTLPLSSGLSMALSSPWRPIPSAWFTWPSFSALPSSPIHLQGRWAWWLDLSWAILGVASVAYALLDLDQFIRRSTLPEPMEVFFGLVAIVLLLELSRRVVDTTFTLVVLGFRRGGS